MPTFAPNVLIDWHGDGLPAADGAVDALGTMTVDDLGTMTVDELMTLLSDEDATVDVRQSVPIVIKRGRDFARELAPFRAGTVELLLSNEDGKYSSKNVASPLFGLVKSGRELIVEITDTVTLVDAYAATVLADAPSGYWRLGEPSGTSAADASGFARTGTYTGGYTLAAAGALAGDADTAVLLNGTTGWVSVPATGLKPTAAVTLEAWVYFAAVADVSTNPIVLTQDATGNYLRLLSGAVPLASIRVGGVQSTIQSTALAAGWHHIAATWATGDRLRLYVNGVQVAQSASTIAGTLDSSGSIIEIGRFSASLYFKGRVDEAAIYPTALSAARVLAHDQAGLGTLTHDVATTYPMAVAYTNEPSEQPLLRERSVRIYALDGLGRAGAATIYSDRYTSIRIDVAIGVVLDLIGWPADRRTLDVAATTLTGWFVAGITAFQALKELVLTEGVGAMLYVDGDGDVVFESRHYRLVTTRSTTSQGTFRDQGAEPLMSQFSVVPGETGIVNSCTIPVRSYALAALAQVWTGPTPLVLTPGQVWTQTISTDGVAFDNAVNPTAGAGDFTVSAGAVVSATLDRDGGKTALLTIVAGAAGATLTGLRVRAQAVTITEQLVSNTVDASASIADHGLQTLPSDFVPKWVPTVAEAEDFANAVVGRNATERAQVVIGVNNLTATRLTQALARRISDRVTAIDTSAIASFNADAIVEAVEYRFDSHGDVLEASFYCEEARGQSYWTLGVAGLSELGDTARLGY